MIEALILFFKTKLGMVAAAGLVALAVGVAGYWKGYDVAEEIALGKEAKAQQAYQEDIAKKATIINDQNLAFAASETAHKGKEASLQSKYEKAMAAVAKMPPICADSDESLQDLNAIIGAAK